MVAPPSFASVAPPPAAGASVGEWRAAIRALPIEMREAMADLFTPAAFDADRLEQRDGVLARMAAGLGGSANAQAGAIHRSLSRYAAAAWRFDRERAAPHDGRHALVHRALTLSRGEVPAARTIRRRLANLATGGRRGGQQGWPT